MSRLFVYLVTCLFVVACSKSSAIPKDILRPAQMKAVMWDMLRADEIVNVEAEKDTAFDREGRSAQLYNQVFKIHGINQATFRNSLHFYERRPDLFQPILDSLKVVSEKTSVAPSTAAPTPIIEQRVDTAKPKIKRLRQLD